MQKCAFEAVTCCECRKRAETKSGAELGGSVSELLMTLLALQGNALSFLSRLHLKKFIFQKRDAVGSCGVNTLASICLFFSQHKASLDEQSSVFGCFKLYFTIQVFPGFYLESRTLALMSMPTKSPV